MGTIPYGSGYHVRAERIRSTDAQAYFVSAPEYAFEIVSPSDTPGDLDRKVDLLLAHGALAIWLIYPETRRVRVFQRDGSSFSRGIGEKLTLPELLPDWELPVAKLFEE